MIFVQYLRIFIHFKEIIANFVGVKDGAELRIMSYELRITNYEFEWHADTSRPFSTRFDRFRNKFGMGGVKHPLAFTPTRLFGYFSIGPVCRRIAGITPSPKGCATNATTNLHFVKKGISRYDRNVGFPTRSFCTLQGGVAG